MSTSEVPDVKEGDKVSWPWGSGAPGGKASEVKADEVKMTTKRGNEVTKKGEEGNPAVRIERSGHDVVKKANELEVEEEGPKHKGDKSDDKQNGEKEEDAKEDEQKDDEEEEKPKETKKKRGAPKGKRSAAAKDTGASKKKTEKPKKRAATESGEPRRSKRNKA